MRKDMTAFAKIDPAFMLDGLFVPRANKNKPIDIKHEWDKGYIRFMGVQLGAMHQSILLAVCGRMGRSGTMIHKREADARQITFWDDMEAEDLGKGFDLGLIHTTAYSILRDSGITEDGRSYKRLITALEDLSRITIGRQVKKMGQRFGGSMHMLSFTNRDNKLEVKVNWRLARAVLGDQQNIQVSLIERAALKSPAAKILHAWLSAHIWLGQSLMSGQGATEAALMKHIWGEPDKLPKNASAAVKDRFKSQQSLRRKTLREALKEIGTVEGWAVTKTGSKWLISRPKMLPNVGVELNITKEDIEQAIQHPQLSL